jgi:methionyl-tRNA formyltransferase
MAARVLFMGNHNIGHDALRELLDCKAEVAAVFAHPDTNDPRHTWYRSVKQLAIEREVPVYQPQTLKDDKVTSIVRDLAPDLLLSVSYGRIIPPEILDISSIGAVNLHGSLLPDYRGRFCPIWAIVNDEQVTGMTLHFIDEGIDTGDIIAQAAIGIQDVDTGYSLYMRLCAAGLKLLSDTLPVLLQGSMPRKPQPHIGSYYSAMTESDRRICWNKPTRSIYNLIRACFFPPYPSSYTFRRGAKVNILRATAVDVGSKASPGTIVATEDGCPIVRTGDGAISLDEGELFAPDAVVGEQLG